MALVNKIDSNITGLRYCEEVSPRVLPGSPVWIPLEPNSYSDFGGNLSTMARNPINPSRQRKKGIVVDLDASGGFNTDLTQENLQDLLQGFMFADLRKKNEISVPVIDAVNSEYEPVTGGASYTASDLIVGKNFAAPQNNGLKVVTGTPTTSAVKVAETLIAATGQTGTISRVGVRNASGTISASIAGAFPALVQTGGRSFLTYGLSIGEWVFIGGDATANQFANANINGFARVRAITATNLSFDKTSFTWANDAGTGKSIDVYFGRVLKNELGSLIKRRSYQLERTLGAPDNALPSNLQAEYLEGSFPNEMTLNISSGDKITVDLSFVSMDHVLRTATLGVKSGTRPSITESDAFNTSTDITQIKLAKVDNAVSAVTPLFAFAEEVTLTLNNGIEPDKAIGVIGGFDVSAGTFAVGGNLTAYFANVEAVAAVRNNDDITLHIHSVRNNAGITIDIPLIALGDGRLNVEQDRSIKLPLSTEAATGAKIDTNLDHTLLFVFWDYLPDLAE